MTARVPVVVDGPEGHRYEIRPVRTCAGHGDTVHVLTHVGWECAECLAAIELDPAGLHPAEAVGLYPVGSARMEPTL